MFTDPATWSEKLQSLVQERQVEVRPYKLHLTYDDWTMRMCIIQNECLDLDS